MKFVTHFVCTTCGVLADEHFKEQDCPQCGNKQWASIKVRCTCLQIGPTLMYQDIIIVPNPNCKACN